MKSNFQVLVPEGAKLDPYCMYKLQVIFQMGPVARIPVFEFSGQLRLRPCCLATKIS